MLINEKQCDSINLIQYYLECSKILYINLQGKKAHNIKKQKNL